MDAGPPQHTPSEPEFVESPTPDPAVQLRRARLLGHRIDRLPLMATPRTPNPKPAAGAPPAPHVQRKVYLANNDENLYKDTDHPDLELSYIAKTGKNRPIFLPYDVFLQMQGAVWQAWNDNVVAHGLEKFYSFTAVAQDFLGRNMKAEYANVLWENPDGKLEPYGLKGVALLYDLAKASEIGPRYWHQGGGSRLPPAAGTLVSHDLELKSVLDQLGITAEEYGKKYRNVKFIRAPDIVQYMQLWEAAQGKNLIQEKDFFYVSDVAVGRSKGSRVLAAGVVYREDFAGVGPPEATQLGLKLNALPAPQTQDWDDVLTPRDRGEGQAKAMGGWNALGASAFVDKYRGRNLPLDQNWEWLHVRGAQIGGVTAGGNLVPGLFVTNSAMIPYESAIARWAVRGPKKVFARFAIGNTQDQVFTDKISIQVAADNHPDLGTIPKADPASVAFDPLNGKVVDKFAGRIREAQMKRKLEEKATMDDDEGFEIVLSAQPPSGDEAASSSSSEMKDD